MRSTFPFVMLASVTRAYRLGPSVLRAPVTTSLRRASTQTVSMGAERDDIRNIAIVAHVDHGKTSLVDSMLVAAESLNQNIGEDDRLENVLLGEVRVLAFGWAHNLCFVLVVGLFFQFFLLF